MTELNHMTIAKAQKHLCQADSLMKKLIKRSAPFALKPDLE